MKRLLGYFVVLTLGVVPTLAQSRLEAPDTENYLRWGSIRGRPGLELSRIGYDNNILQSTDSSPDGRVGDYTATVSPKLDLLTLMGRSAFLTFEQRFDYTVYANRVDQNFLNSRTSARATIPLKSRFGFFVEGLYQIRHERPPDLARARPKLNYVNLGYGFILEPGWRTQIEVGAITDDYKYTDSDVGPDVTAYIASRLNRFERGGSVDFRYLALTRTRVVFNGLVKNIDFDQTITIEDFPSPGEQQIIGRDANEWRAVAGLEFGRGGRVTGVFLVGWNQIKPEDSRIQTLSIPIGEASLAYRFSPRTRLEINGQRISGFAVFGLNSYYLTSETELRVVHFFNRPFGLEAAVGTGQLTFPASLNVLEREDDLNRYELGVRLHQAENSMGKRSEYSFMVRHVQRRSSIPALDRSDASISFGAVFGY